MPDEILTYLDHAGGAISLFGVVVVVVGFGLAAWHYVVACVLGGCR